MLARIRYLDVGLAVILMFIGLKMIAGALVDSGVHDVGFVHVPSIGAYASLAFIVAVLGLVADANWVRGVAGKP